MATRDSQVAVEVLHNPDSKVRDSQVVVEALRGGSLATIRCSQVVVEVLRPRNIPTPHAARRQVLSIG